MSPIAIALIVSLSIGCATIAACIVLMRRDRPVPPAKLKGAGQLHAKQLDDTRLCPKPGGLATTFWQLVDCPDCQREVDRILHGDVS